MAITHLHKIVPGPGWHVNRETPAEVRGIITSPTINGFDVMIATGALAPWPPNPWPQGSRALAQGASG